ncbi:MAG: DNA polymerase III subunit [Polyangiaceae bacterium]
MGRVLDQVRAQDTAVETLRRALANGRVHHALLFDGPDGVGKELVAFGLAQALVCAEPQDGQACGACSACSRAVPREGEDRPVHPDVVVLERGLYEPAQIGRRTPESQEISIDQVRTLVLARAAFAPHEGRAKVFIIRRAEELSTSAANALLKTLEEPGQRTHFILLSAQADSLLPTIRSRTLRVRFGALPDALVAELLAARGVDAEAAARIAKIASGSMAVAQTHADPEASERRERFLAQVKAALAGPSLAAALALAEEAKKDKAALAPGLIALATELAAEARAHAGATDDDTADAAAARFRMVQTALVALDGNASPQLTAESLLIRMRGV